MKAPVRSSKRAVTAAVAGLTAVTALTALSGCGFETRQQAAAVVNGRVIHESAVAETARQLRESKGVLQEGASIPEGVIVKWLVAEPLLTDALKASGGWKQSPEFARVVALIPNATDATKAFIRSVVLVESGQLSQTVDSSYSQALDKADISINPKYGALQANGDPLHFTLAAAQPNWILTSPEQAQSPEQAPSPSQ